jgi:hypothetical protein
MGVVDAKKLSIFDPRGGKAVTSYKVAEDDWSGLSGLIAAEYNAPAQADDLSASIQ